MVDYFGTKRAHTNSYYTCSYCGKMLSANNELTMTKPSDWKTKRVCKECFQKEELDKQGTCPQCNKPMIVGEEISCAIADYKWYHKTCLEKKEHLPKNLPSQSPPPIVKETIVKETIREVVVKIRCPYCSNVYDETLDKCPHCGAKHT